MSNTATENANLGSVYLHLFGVVRKAIGDPHAMLLQDRLDKSVVTLETQVQCGKTEEMHAMACDVDGIVCIDIEDFTVSRLGMERVKCQSVDEFFEKHLVAGTHALLVANNRVLLGSSARDFVEIVKAHILKNPSVVADDFVIVVEK